MGAAVLVVDDDPAIAGVLAELLADEGYAVRTAPDGQAALAAVARQPADLILSDVLAPPCITTPIPGQQTAVRETGRGDKPPRLPGQVPIVPHTNTADVSCKRSRHAPRSGGGPGGCPGT